MFFRESLEGEGGRGFWKILFISYFIDRIIKQLPPSIIHLGQWDIYLWHKHNFHSVLLPTQFDYKSIVHINLNYIKSNKYIGRLRTRLNSVNGSSIFIIKILISIFSWREGRGYKKWSEISKKLWEWLRRSLKNYLPEVQSYQRI